MAFATVMLPEALARAAEQWLSEFNSQNVADMAWAFAAGNHQDEMLFATLAIAAKMGLSELNWDDVANTAWVLATAYRRNKMLFAARVQFCAASTRAAERRQSAFKPRALANTAWAFATVNNRDEKYAALWRAAERRLTSSMCRMVAFASTIYRVEILRGGDAAPNALPLWV